VKITNDKFFTDAFSLTSFGPTWIHNSYRQFIFYFQNCKVIRKHEFIVGAYFTYGWMPTMLHLEEDISIAVQVANNAKNGKMITDDEMESLACAVNGSFVGASKLLHFINPDIYSIWDSRVYRYLFAEPPYQYRLESISKYREFRAFIETVEADSRCKQVVENISESIGYKISSKRAVELVMYLKGGK
jgi:hypothetical protein